MIETKGLGLSTGVLPSQVSMWAWLEGVALPNHFTYASSSPQARAKCWMLPTKMFRVLFPGDNRTYSDGSGCFTFLASVFQHPSLPWYSGGLVFSDGVFGKFHCFGILLDLLQIVTLSLVWCVSRGLWPYPIKTHFATNPSFYCSLLEWPLPIECKRCIFDNTT